MLTILVVSDATGETAERIVRSALVQFKNAPAEVVRRGRVRTLAQVRSVVREAAERRALILHTLVSNKLRRSMLAESRRRGVDAMDLMGPVLDRLASHLQLTPREKPGLFKQLKEYKSREIEAVEFAFQHDDGQHPQGLKRAEVASELEISPDRVDNLVAQAYSQMFYLDRALHSRMRSVQSASAW